MPGVENHDTEYLAARRVLLDALEALGTHRKSVVLVGAQAIYLHVGEGDLAVAPYTTDADLVIDPRQLSDEPALAQAMENAGFELTVRPGTWTMKTTAVQVDFLVPAALGGPGRRGARLGIHGIEVARKSKGLEAAIVDHTSVRVSALDPADNRSFDISVAGVTALLVAKLHKIAERKDNKNRLQDKDALDILRLLRASDTGYLGKNLSKLANHDIAGDITREAWNFLSELFGGRNSVGTLMAVRATAGLEDGVSVALSCEVLARRLLSEWKA